MNNSQLSFKIGRTEDSVRKELNKMKLKRPKKSDYPKIYHKRGRKKKIYSITESIQRGLEQKKKADRIAKREAEKAKAIANEALWAADFVHEAKPIIPRSLVNPVIVEAPDARAIFQIDSDLPATTIKSKIAAIKSRYGNINVSNFQL